LCLGLKCQWHLSLKSTILGYKREQLSTFFYILCHINHILENITVIKDVVSIMKNLKYYKSCIAISRYTIYYINTLDLKSNNNFKFITHSHTFLCLKEDFHYIYL
jgi:hypothetical protein